MKAAAIARVHAPAAVLVVALALFGLALAFELVSHETRHHDSVTSGAESASCGSPVFPVDTWGDCIYRRDRAARFGAGFGAAAVMAAVVGRALVRRARRSVSVGLASLPVRPRIARVGGVALLLIALALVAVPVRVDRVKHPASGAEFTLAGGRSCGSVVNSFGTNQPVDKFGNSDSSCLDAFQIRWTTVGILLASGAILLIGVRTARRRSGTATTAFDAAAMIVIVGSVGLVVLTAVNHFTAARGGR